MTVSLVSPDKTGKLLDVGSGPEKGNTARFYPKMEIVRLDVDPDVQPDIVHDVLTPLPPELHGQFDGVFLSHVLEHFGWRAVVPVLKNLRDALKPGGEILILVPSLEWAAEQIMAEHPQATLQAVLYGSQSNDWQYHRSGFTLTGLRQVLRHAGYIEEYVAQGDFHIRMNDRDYTSLQNVALAKRVD